MEVDNKARERLKSEAAEWLARLDSGSADLEAFEAWRNADPVHASIFAQVAATWKRTGELRGRVAGQGAEAPRASGEARTRRAVLAGGLAAAGAFAFSTVYLNRGARRSFIETAVGERRTLTLPDGSVAELNTDTRIAWAFDRAREFWVERGEAALSIIEDAARPFLLRSITMKAELEAGRYNMRLRARGPELTAISGGGSVALENGPKRRLEEGHRIAAAGGALDYDALAADRLDAIQAWRRGEIVFDGMTLGEALAEFNRYLPQKIIFADRELASIRLGGRFMVDDPAAFLHALQDGFDIENRKENDRIILFAKT